MKDLNSNIFDPEVYRMCQIKSYWFYTYVHTLLISTYVCIGHAIPLLGW